VVPHPHRDHVFLSAEAQAVDVVGVGLGVGRGRVVGLAFVFDERLEGGILPDICPSRRAKPDP